MAADGTPRLWFEVDSDRDPIAGHMHVGDEPRRSFGCWLELVALIEQTRAGSPAAVSAARDQQGPSARADDQEER